MSLFLIVFFALYGGMHLYAFLRVRAAFAPGVVLSAGLMLFMSLMVLAPVMVRMSEKAGHELLARTLAWAGYVWMGLLLLFFSCSVLTDLYRLLMHTGSSILHRDFTGITPSVKYSVLYSLLVSLLITSYGYFEARDLRTERLTIGSPKIPKEVGKIRIALISDVHLGLIVRTERMKRIVELAKEADPDIFVSAGDLVDGQLSRLEGLEGLLSEINPRYGKFAVTGNHEFYSGLHQALEFKKKSGFTVLRGKGLTVAGVINIAGVDDPVGKTLGFFHEVSEKDVLSGLPRDKFTLLLKHRPLVDKASEGLFDLQLSGHTHKGQIFPFSLATKLYYPLHAGFLRLRDGGGLYVSRGTGTWGPPIRFLSPPEVTVIDLVHEEK